MSDTIIVYENGKAVGGEGHPTNADEITFDNTGTDLVSEEVESAIKEVNAKFDRGSVSVTGNGVKTWGQLLTELAGIVDFTRLTDAATLRYSNHIYKIRAVTSSSAYFVAAINTTSALSVSTIFVDANSAYFADANVTLSPITGAGDNHTSSVLANGATITIYY